jgi:hypothetical protein
MGLPRRYSAFALTLARWRPGKVGGPGSAVLVRRFSCTALHSPSLSAVGMLRSFSPAAVARSDATPAACSSAIVGIMSRRPRVGARLRGRRSLGADLCRRDHAAISAKLHAAPLRRLQRGLCPGADHAGFQFGNRDDLLEEEAAGRTFDLWQVRETDIDPGFEQSRQQADRSREPVDLAHDRKATMEARSGERFVQLRPIGALAALDLGELADDLPVSAV